MHLSLLERIKCHIALKGSDSRRNELCIYNTYQYRSRIRSKTNIVLVQQRRNAIQFATE